MFGRCFGYDDFFLFINLPLARPMLHRWLPQVEGMATLILDPSLA